MTTWRLMMLSGPLFAPATVPLVAVASVISVDMHQKEDGTHEMTVSAPAGAAWLEYVQARRVIWVWIDGEVTEWMIARRADALGNAVVTVYCDPLHRMLADFGVIQHVSSPGGRPASNLRGLNGTVENFLTTYAQERLEQLGVDGWVGIGDSDFPTERFDLAFDVTNIWGLTIAVRDRVNGVARLRRDEYDQMYLIDVLRSFTEAGVPVFWIAEGRNLQALGRNLDREKMRTALRPVGELLAGEEQRASIMFATHVVLAKSTHTLTLGRHGYEADATVGPVAQDGQFAPVLVDGNVVYPGKYLEAMDGTRSAVVSSLAPQTVVVASGTAFAVGDDVFFVDDASGTGLTELAFPDAIQESGYVQGTAELPYAGHRNWIRNPGWSKWAADAPPQVKACALNGIHSSATTINLKNLPAGLSIPAGEALQIGVSSVDRITAPATVGGGGTVAVTIATARTAGDNTTAQLYRQQNRGPTYWTRLPADAGIATPLRTPRVASGTISALANGTQTNVISLVMDGIPPGEVLSPGYLVAGGSSNAWIVEGATADGGGNATVVLLGPVNVTDNDSLTIHKPNIGAGSGYAAGQFGGLLAGAAAAPTLSHDFTVRYVPGITNLLWIKVDLVAMSNSTTGWNASSGFERPPRARIMDATGAVELAGVNAANWSPASAGQHFEEAIAVGYEITSSTTLKAQLRWPYSTVGDNAAIPYTWPRFVQVHLGMSSELAFVEGSAAAPLFYNGQIVGQLHSQWGATYSATEVELSHALGIPPTVAPTVLGLGSVIRIRSESPRVRNVLLRVIGIRVSRESGARVLTLGSAPEHFTDQVSAKKAGRQYVDVDVTVVAPAAGEIITVKQTVLTSSEPPLGSITPRFVVPPGSDPAGPQPVEEA